MKAGVLVIYLAAISSAAGASLTTDFSTDPGGSLLGKAKIDGGSLKLQDLQEYIDGNSTLPMFGSYVFPAIDGAQKVASFTADFKVSIHGGTETPAQGFSFVLASDIAGFTDPFREGGATGEGTGFSQGLIISFDTVDNLPGFGANGNDSGDAPGIIVKIGGQRVAAKRFTGLRTGPANNQAPVFVPVQVKLDADGTLDVVYNGTKVYDNFGIPYAPIAGNFGVGAGTAELTAAIRANHWFDDMTITTTTVGAGPVLLSAQPLGTSVRPDAIVEVQVENLGGATVQVQFDNQPVQHQASTAGTVTTISFDPPGTLAPNSTNNVTVTYGGKTLTWGFTVLNATIVPGTFAVASASVDTATSGFKVRVHQLETAAPGGNTFQRAEDQLAGKLGPNVADLTVPPANADGTFDKLLINMEQEALEAGNFNATEGHPDETIPGIPGSVGNTDNIAMEVRGYLELVKGVYTFGLVSDDNARLTIGPDPRDATAAKLIDITIGTATSTVLVDADGIYPFRVVWAEGGGGANLELWNVTASGTRILLNDRATTGHVKVYRQLKTGIQPPPYVSLAKPAPGDVNVSTIPKIELAITEETTQVNPTSIKLSINGVQVTLAAGDVTKLNNVTTIHYTSSTLPPKSEQRIKLEFIDSVGQNVTREYTFTTGSGPTGAGFAGAQWDFDQGNLAASLGHDLQYLDASLAARYQYGTTTSFGIPDIGGTPARVVHIPFTPTDETDGVGPIFKRIGLQVNHGLGSNGGSLTNKLNQYTLIMDVLWGTDGPSGFGSILQTHDFANPTDGDMFWRASDGSYGKGCCSLYDNIVQQPGHNHVRGEWARIVFSVDLASTPRKVAKFVNGFKHREDVIGDGNAVDSRFALPPEFFMFGDGDDDERTDCYVNSLQIRQGAMTDEEVAALGGATAEGIPLPFAQWDFDQGNLAATMGHDLEYLDASLAARYQYGTTTSFGIPDIAGSPARVIHIPFNARDETDGVGPIFKRLGLRVNHGLGSNGASLTNKLNQYTLIMDLLWGTDGPSGFGSILQTHDFANPTDGDMFWRASDGSYGKGCCSLYDNIVQQPGHNHVRGEWARIVFSVDLASTPRKVAKFVNGFKHREDVIGDGNAVDSRFALPPEFFMFGDGDDDERTDCYLNSLQVRQGAMTDDEVAALGGATAPGIPLPYSQWDFDEGNLAATMGHDLEYLDSSLATRYQYGTTTSFGIPDIGGNPARVVHIPFNARDEVDGVGPIFKRLGLRVNHGLGSNGASLTNKLNQYTLIMDLLWGTDGPSGFGSILQTHDFANPTDGDMFWRASDGSYGKGCCSLYDNIVQQPGHNHVRGEWARIVFSVDLASTPRKVAKFVNGFKHREDVIGDGNAVDSRFALPPEYFMFGDGDDDERTDCYVNSLQIRQGAMSDEDVAALGGATDFGIPAPAAGAVATAPAPIRMQFSHTATDLTITVTGGAPPFTLQRRADLNAATQWQDAGAVSGNSITVTNAFTGAQGYYRIRGQ